SAPERFLYWSMEADGISNGGDGGNSPTSPELIYFGGRPGISSRQSVSPGLIQNLRHFLIRLNGKGAERLFGTFAGGLNNDLSAQIALVCKYGIDFALLFCSDGDSRRLYGLLHQFHPSDSHQFALV